MDALSACLQDLPHRQVPLQTVKTAASNAAQVHWQMLRLDVNDAQLSGNKLFKLIPYLQKARALKKDTLLSFGGMHSNHLHALAAAGLRFSFNTVAVVRGYQEQTLTPTLQDLLAMGMQIHFVGKAEYAQRYQSDYQAMLSARYNNALVINEGGAGDLGEQGARMMAQVIAHNVPHMPDVIALAAGTGTSFNGLLQSREIPEKTQIMAVAALNNCAVLEQQAEACARQNWQVIDGYQCGGFAKVNRQLALFMQQFEQQQAIPLEPVYTAKLCLAIDSMINSGQIKRGSHIVSLHTGGLQGRRALQHKITTLAGDNHRELREHYV